LTRAGSEEKIPEGGKGSVRASKRKLQLLMTSLRNKLGGKKARPSEKKKIGGRAGPLERETFPQPRGLRGGEKGSARKKLMLAFRQVTSCWGEGDSAPKKLGEGGNKKSIKEKPQGFRFPPKTAEDRSWPLKGIRLPPAVTFFSKRGGVLVGKARGKLLKKSHGQEKRGKKLLG